MLWPIICSSLPSLLSEYKTALIEARRTNALSEKSVILINGEKFCGMQN
jgi:hypothetical protein